MVQCRSFALITQCSRMAVLRIPNYGLIGTVLNGQCIVTGADKGTVTSRVQPSQIVCQMPLHGLPSVGGGRAGRVGAASSWFPIVIMSTISVMIFLAMMFLVLFLLMYWREGITVAGRSCVAGAICGRHSERET